MTDNPKPHSFDWLIEPVERQVMEVPLPPGSPGYRPTLRVEIEARARVVPTRGWGLFMMIWMAFVTGLLLAISVHTARGATWEDQNAQRRAPAWGSWDSQRSAPAWGQSQPGRTTSYYPVQRSDGTTGQCAFWHEGNQPVMRCE